MAVRKTKAGARLKRWFKEDWRTPKGKKDYSGGENTFRPTKRVSRYKKKNYGGIIQHD